MNLRHFGIWFTVLASLILVSAIAATSATAQITAVKPYHCDFNGDGKADILWRDPVNFTLDIWYMNGLTFSTAADNFLLTFWQVVACGDLFGDGHTTGIMWKQPQTNEIAFWGSGGGCAAAAASPWLPGNAADMNGDGKLDLLWRNPATGERAVWYLNGCDPDFFHHYNQLLVQGAAYLPSVDPAWHLDFTGDFDGDGKADFFWKNYSTGEVAIWLMNNTTILASAPFGPYADWNVVQVADFDGDGKSDLLWQNHKTGELGIWFMNGVTASSYAYLPSISPEWSAVGSDDYDGDGNNDLLWFNSTTGDVAIWLMQGSTILQSGIVANLGAGNVKYPISGRVPQ